jgi:hypothetical protein
MKVTSIFTFVIEERLLYGTELRILFKDYVCSIAFTLNMCRAYVRKGQSRSDSFTVYVVDRYFLFRTPEVRTGKWLFRRIRGPCALWQIHKTQYCPGKHARTIQTCQWTCKHQRKVQQRRKTTKCASTRGASNTRQNLSRPGRESNGRWFGLLIGYLGKQRRQLKELWQEIDPDK